MKVKSVLVSQPAPTIENSPYISLKKKRKVKIDFIPLSKDLIVILSGIVEIILGLGLAFWKSKRQTFGWALAIFFVLIFPGNIAQYIEGTDAFGVLDSDEARLRRLFFQPVLVLWVLWASGAWKTWRMSKKNN